MLYRAVPKTGEKLSILGFGAMRLPRAKGRIDEEASTRLIRHSIDNGIAYVDTAWPYHNGASEPFLRKALGGGYREKVKLATKLPQWLVKSRKDMDYYLDLQLEESIPILVETLHGHPASCCTLPPFFRFMQSQFLNDGLSQGQQVAVATQAS